MKLVEIKYYSEFRLRDGRGIIKNSCALYEFYMNFARFQEIEGVFGVKIQARFYSFTVKTPCITKPA